MRWYPRREALASSTALVTVPGRQQIGWHGVMAVATHHDDLGGRGGRLAAVLHGCGVHDCCAYVLHAVSVVVQPRDHPGGCQTTASSLQQQQLLVVVAPCMVGQTGGAVHVVGPLCRRGCLRTGD